MAYCRSKDSLQELCEVLKPPPLPPSNFEGFEEILSYLADSDSYKCYTKICNETAFEITTQPTTTESSTSPSTLSVTISSTEQGTSPSTSSVTISSTEQGTSPSTSSVTISSTEQATPSTPTSIVTIASTIEPAITEKEPYWVIIIVFIIIGLIIVAVVFWWKKRSRSRGSASVNSLPLKKYEDTNYLASKAQAGQCWSPSTDVQLSSSNTGNQYGSFPPLNGDIKLQVAMNNETGGEANKGDSVSGRSEVVGYVNENFNREEGNGARSPGVDSQTPLFDVIDGVLPNAVPPNGTEIQESKSEIKTVELDLENGVSQFSEPAHSGQPDDSVVIRPQKRKSKPVPVSAPVKIMEDDNEDSAVNRKSL